MTDIFLRAEWAKQWREGQSLSAYETVVRNVITELCEELIVARQKLARAQRHVYVMGFYRGKRLQYIKIGVTSQPLMKRLDQNIRCLNKWLPPTDLSKITLGRIIGYVEEGYLRDEVVLKSLLKEREERGDIISMTPEFSDVLYPRNVKKLLRVFFSQGFYRKGS